MSVNTLPDIIEERPDDPNDPALKYFKVTVNPSVTSLGMRFINTEVCHVYPGGFAEKAGVEMDDELWDIDGVPFCDIGKDKNDPDKDCTEDQVKALQKRPIVINFKRPKYKDTYYEVDFNDKKIGVKYLENVITTVHAGEWADRSGVKAGDLLLTMNGKLFEKMSSSEVFHMIRNAPKPIKMYFKRPAEVNINIAAIESGAYQKELDLKEDPNDPALSYYELKVEQPGNLGMRWIGSEVVHIVKDSWAHIRKVEVDDEILEINGKSFVYLSEAEQTKAISQKPPFNIKFKRPKFKDSYYSLVCEDTRLGLKYFNGTITSLTPGLWGERMGVVVGDVLIDVDGLVFSELDDNEVIKILQGPRPLKMLFKRPAQVNKDLYAIKEGQKGRDNSMDSGAGNNKSGKLQGDMGEQLGNQELIVSKKPQDGSGCCFLCM